MSTFFQLLFLAGCGFGVWLIIQSVRRHPESFSKENFGKSAHTMGLLALALIAFVAFLIWSVRH